MDGAVLTTYHWWVWGGGCAAAARKPTPVEEEKGPLERKMGAGMRPIDELLKDETDRDSDYSGPGIRPGRLMVRPPYNQRTHVIERRAGARCMSDVKEVHTAVCIQLPSAFLYEEKGGVWTYESEVSSPSIRRISSM